MFTVAMQVSEWAGGCAGWARPDREGWAKGMVDVEPSAAKRISVSGGVLPPAVNAAHPFPHCVRAKANMLVFLSPSLLPAYTHLPSIHLQSTTCPCACLPACLQLPQGALCYWATSSTLALLQNHALKQESVRHLVGLPSATVASTQQIATMSQPPVADADAVAATAAAVVAGAAGPLPAGIDPELRQFLLTTSDQAALFDKAAALRAEGRAGATSTVLQRLLQLYPGQPNALFALGQVTVSGWLAL